ncbi:MAG: Na(+)/H(+) antiporter subunit B, partial [Planctomycetaceae bacterium]|nr:Na(+)/H(+) antiporter subunit B [Planctomycetaceae bacterium]
MPSLILQTASRLLQPLLLLTSIFLLIRGHNEPGGGFVGGLIAAAAFALYAIAYDVPFARRALQIDPHLLIGGGLLCALISGLIAPLLGEPFLRSLWIDVNWGPVHLELGTP